MSRRAAIETGTRYICKIAYCSFPCNCAYDTTLTHSPSIRNPFVLISVNFLVLKKNVDENIWLPYLPSTWELIFLFYPAQFEREK